MLHIFDGHTEEKNQDLIIFFPFIKPELIAEEETGSERWN